MRCPVSLRNFTTVFFLSLLLIGIGWKAHDIHQQSNPSKAIEYVPNIYAGEHSNTTGETKLALQLFNPYDKAETAPYVFVGGHPSSGTTLLRVLIDMHPMIRCGSETYILVSFLNQYDEITGDRTHLTEIGVMPYALNNATAAYIMNIINRMGKPAPFLCHKQSLDRKQIPNLARLFPKAKFVTIIRDGRSITESIISRGFDRVSFNKEDPLRGLRTWEHRTRQLMEGCHIVGASRCLSFRYEELVMQTELVMRRVFKFLQVPWDPIVLEHEDHLAEIEGITKHEKHQRVQQKVQLNTLDRWYRTESILPDWFKQQAHKKSELLQELGYASIGLPPNYTKLALPLPEFI